jgi:cohesin loading factor subunit SCC2
LEEDDSGDEDDSASEDNGRNQLPLRQLSSRIEPLFDNAAQNAQYITRYLVQRAMTSTKTGDQPYRNLLDLFTEDLISVLGSSDWPGAELLLTMLASQMIGIMEHDKSLANAKNMALELLGWMGSAISELISTARHLCNAIDDSDAELTHYLRQMFEDHTNRTLHVEDLIVLNGPYRVVLEYLEERNVGRSQLSAARGYLLAQWGKTVCTVYQASKAADATAGDAAVQSLAESVNDILSNPRWLEVNR